MAQQQTDFGQVANDMQRAAASFAALTSSATLFGSALQSFREFEQQLVLTNAIAGGTEKTFRQLSRAAREFSLITTASATESGRALQQLAQAGFTAQQSLNALTGVLLLSQATLSDVAFSSDVLSSTIRAFGLTVTDTTRVANVFSAAITGSLATIDKLAFAMRQVAPVAELAGLSIEETTAALGVLFNVGLRGEQAGTALRNIIIRLVRPLGEARDLLFEAGIATQTATGELRNLNDILKEIGESDLTDAQLARIFETEALSSVKAYITALETINEITGKNEYETLRDGITGTNRAAEIAAENLNTLDGSLKLLNNTTQDALKTIGAEFAPIIQDLSQYIRDLYDQFRELEPEQRKQIVQWIAIGGAAVSALAALNAISLLFTGPLVRGVAAFATRMAGLAVSMPKVSAAFTAARVSGAGFAAASGSALAALAPMAATIAAVAAAAYGLVRAYDALTFSSKELRSVSENLEIDPSVQQDAEDTVDRILGEGVVSAMERRVDSLRKQTELLRFDNPLNFAQFSDRAQQSFAQQGNQGAETLQEIQDNFPAIYEYLREREAVETAIEEQRSEQSISDAFLGDVTYYRTERRRLAEAFNNLSQEEKALFESIEENYETAIKTNQEVALDIANAQKDELNSLLEVLELIRKGEFEGPERLAGALTGIAQGGLLSDAEILQQVAEELAGRDEAVSLEDAVREILRANGATEQEIEDAVTTETEARNALLVSNLQKALDEADQDLTDIETSFRELELERATDIADIIRITRELGVRELEDELRKVQEDSRKAYNEATSEFAIDLAEGIPNALQEAFNDIEGFDLEGNAPAFSSVVSGEAFIQSIRDKIDDSTTEEEARRIIEQERAKFDEIAQAYIRTLVEEGVFDADSPEVRALEETWRQRAQLAIQTALLGLSTTEGEIAEAEAEAEREAQRAADRLKREQERRQREADRRIREAERALADQERAARDQLNSVRQIEDTYRDIGNRLQEAQRVVFDNASGLTLDQRLDGLLGFDVEEITRRYNDEIGQLERELKDLQIEYADQPERLAGVEDQYDRLINKIEEARDAELEATQSFTAQMERRSEALQLLIRDMENVAFEAKDTFTSVGAGVAIGFAEYQDDLVTLTDITKDATLSTIDAISTGVADFIYDSENAWEAFKKTMLNISRQIFEGFTKAFIQQSISSLTGGEGGILGNALQPSGFGDSGTPGVGNGGILGQLFPGLTGAFDQETQDYQESESVYEREQRRIEATLQNFNTGLDRAFKEAIAAVRRTAAGVDPAQFAQNPAPGAAGGRGPNVPIGPSGYQSIDAAARQATQVMQGAANQVASLGTGKANEGDLIVNLMGRGFSAAQAQGIVANFIAESGLDAGINEANPLVEGSRGGFGLYQLTGSRRRTFESFAQERGSPLNSIDAQLDFLELELSTTEKSAARALRATTSAEEAARVFSEDFLRPGIPHLDRRIGNATRLSQQYPGGGFEQDIQTAAVDMQSAADTLNSGARTVSDGLVQFTGGMNPAMPQQQFGNQVGTTLSTRGQPQQNPLAALGGQGAGDPFTQGLMQSQQRITQSLNQFGNQLANSLNAVIQGIQSMGQQVAGGGNVTFAGAASSPGLMGGGGGLGGFLGSLLGFADGSENPLKGPGGYKDDGMLARVSTGEFIMNARATEANLPMLKAMNEGRIPRFADGGLVGGGTFNQSNRTENANLNVTYNIMGGGDRPDKMRRSTTQQAKQLLRSVEKARKNV